jgi:hypothetical protein
LAIEDLARRNSVLRVEHVPVVHGLCADERKCSLANPPPELNVFLMAVGLQTFFGLEVKQLQCPALRLESNDGLSQVHNGAVGADRSPDDIVGILKVDDDSLGGRVGFVVDLSHANVLVRLECLGLLSAYLHLVCTS